jgi:hypothetical protein
MSVQDSNNTDAEKGMLPQLAISGECTRVFVHFNALDNSHNSPHSYLRNHLGSHGGTGRLFDCLQNREYRVE